ELPDAAAATVDAAAPQPDASPPSPDAAPPAACNSLTLDGAPSVEVKLVGAAAPLPMGGPVHEGSYVLTSANVYTGPGGTSGSFGSSEREKLVLAAGTTKSVFTLPDDTTAVRSGTFSTSGHKLTMQLDCPAAGQPSTTDYTATATSLTLYS